MRRQRRESAMARDERIPRMTDDLTKGLLEFIRRTKDHFSKQFEIKEDQAVRFNSSFNLSLRKALREVQQQEKKGKKFTHLFCGAQFPTREAAEQHSKTVNCKPSKRTREALAAQDRILGKRKAP